MENARGGLGRQGFSATRHPGDQYALGRRNTRDGSLVQAAKDLRPPVEPELQVFQTADIVGAFRDLDHFQDTALGDDLFLFSLDQRQRSLIDLLALLPHHGQGRSDLLVAQAAAGRVQALPQRFRDTQFKRLADRIDLRCDFVSPWKHQRQQGDLRLDRGRNMERFRYQDDRRLGAMMPLDAIEQLLQARRSQRLILQGAARILDDDEFSIQVIIQQRRQAVSQVGAWFLAAAGLLVEEIDPTVPQVPFLGAELKVGGNVRHHGVDAAFFPRLDEQPRIAGDQMPFYLFLEFELVHGLYQSEAIAEPMDCNARPADSMARPAPWAALDRRPMAVLETALPAE
ncbi:hypothetical protein D9M72_234350 [compost metagenome]